MPVKAGVDHCILLSGEVQVETPSFLKERIRSLCSGNKTDHKCLSWAKGRVHALHDAVSIAPNYETTIGRNTYCEGGGRPKLSESK